MLIQQKSKQFHELPEFKQAVLFVFYTMQKSKASFYLIRREKSKLWTKITMIIHD